MSKRLITSILFKGFNIANRGLLNKYYNEVIKLNLEGSLPDKEKIYGFLHNRGFNPELEQNPLMQKPDIKAWSENLNNNQVHHWAYTGGSYGEPLKVPYSKNRTLIRTATFRYFNEAGGYTMGDPFVLIRAKDKASLLKFLRNEHIFIPHDTSEPKIKELVRTLKSKKIKVIIGYPTVMYDLAIYLKKFPEEKKGLKIKALISVSEPLEEIKRKVIKEVFNCSFVDRYSTEEVGLIAQQKEFGGPHYVNKFGLYVEVVDPVSLLPVKEGEQGKVVVTDIYNDLIPVVRYDTGDLAVAHQYRDGQLFSITNIQGRTAEVIFATNGSPVSPLMLGPYIYKPLAEQKLVFQYQFAQVTKADYELRIKAKKEDLQPGLTETIIQGLKKALGQDAAIKLRLVEDIKPQPSGKRPVFKNEMKNQNQAGHQ